MPPSLGATPGLPPTWAEYHDGYTSLRCDAQVWQEEIIDTAGQPAMPGLRLPALVHHSLRGCAITFRRGGWEGSEGWTAEAQEGVIGGVAYRVRRHYSPTGGLTYVAYTPYDTATGQEILPLGFDFWVIAGEDVEACLRDVDEVLATFDVDTAGNGSTDGRRPLPLTGWRAGGPTPRCS
jgi:hypothetical protein